MTRRLLIIAAFLFLAALSSASTKVGGSGTTKVGGSGTSKVRLTPDVVEEHTDLKTLNTDAKYIYSVSNSLVFPGNVSGHGPSCHTQTVVIQSGTGWTPGTYTVDIMVRNFATPDGTRDLLHVTVAPAAVSTAGGVGYINGGTSLLVWSGDSIARGNFNSATLLTPPWRTYIGLGGGVNWKVHNRGVSGRTSAALETAYAAEMSVLYDATKSRRVFLMVPIGTNDANLGTTAAAIFQNIKDIAALAKTDGFQVVVATIINRNDAAKSGGWDAIAASLNGLLRDDFGTTTASARVFLPDGGITWADMLLDIQANVNLQNPDDATYFESDKLHPNEAGSQQIADDVVAGIGLLP